MKFPTAIIMTPGRKHRFVILQEKRQPKRQWIVIQVSLRPPLDVILHASWSLHWSCTLCCAYRIVPFLFPTTSLIRNTLPYQLSLRTLTNINEGHSSKWCANIAVDELDVIQILIPTFFSTTGLSQKMDGIWNRYNLKSTGRIYTFAS